LLKFKDWHCISDADWKDVVETFQLDNATIHYIRKKRKEIDSEHVVSKTPGKCGSELNLIELLIYLLTINPPKNPEQKLLIKIGFDAATVTSGK
jgi:hypothetical protein